mmetsp:Transcript_68115/g.181235  ORF Transcript_68115/g.181235 Transcript_68115/m.181235 type:complete len:216 (-) Transcript_68115:198-845(-)
MRSMGCRTQPLVALASPCLRPSPASIMDHWRLRCDPSTMSATMPTHSPASLCPTPWCSEPPGRGPIPLASDSISAPTSLISRTRSEVTTRRLACRSNSPRTFCSSPDVSVACCFARSALRSSSPDTLRRPAAREVSASINAPSRCTSAWAWATARRLGGGAVPASSSSSARAPPTRARGAKPARTGSCAEGHEDPESGRPTSCNRASAEVFISPL